MGDAAIPDVGAVQEVVTKFKTVIAKPHEAAHTFLRSPYVLGGTKLARVPVPIFDGTQVVRVWKLDS